MASLTLLDNRGGRTFGRGPISAGRQVRARRRRVPRPLSGKLPELVSAVHAYEVTEALTFVKDGKVLPHYLT
jgi:hypothetical protein